jgi:Na+-transporting NADH:ubiquinone oxidoreductase subunit NqrB
MTEMAATTMPAGSAVEQGKAPPGRPARRLDPRWLAPILVTSILLAAQLSGGVLEPWQSGTWLDHLPIKTLIAIGTCVLIEATLGRMVLGRFPHLASAYVSGISCGILTRSPNPWVYAYVAALSIASKYALRWRGRHLWNPSNFGVSVMLFMAVLPALFGTPSYIDAASLSIQFGNNAYPMLVVWVLGCAILWKVGRLHVTVAYVTSFLALAFVRTHFTGDPYWSEAAALTGPMYQLYIFFMITDPRTSVTGRWGQAGVAVAIAVVEAAIRLLPVYHGDVGLSQAQAVNIALHAPYFALFLVGPITNLIDWEIRARRVTPGPSGVPPQPRPAA